jgi:hypothetical protein
MARPERAGGLASGGGISNSGDSVWPAVAVGSNGNPWVAWHDETPGSTKLRGPALDGTT